jgi:methionine synthase I (cobalamin-dependent)
LGNYVIRKTADHTWIAIQLFGAVGSIAATALTPEVAFEQAENHYSAKNKSLLKMTIEIEGVETFDLELALNEALKLVSEGYTCGFDRNDTGRYQFSITAIN